MTSVEHDFAGFWNWFGAYADRLRVSIALLAAPEETIQEPLEGPLFKAATARLQDYEPGLAVRFSRDRFGLPVMTITACNRSERFEVADRLVRNAPRFPGWTFQSLMPRGGNGLCVECHSGDWRWAYTLENDRAVISLLALEGKPDRAATESGLALVQQLLGERDFGCFIERVEVLRYEEWLRSVPGGQSCELRQMPGRLDALFQTFEEPDAGTMPELAAACADAA